MNKGRAVTAIMSSKLLVVSDGDAAGALGVDVGLAPTEEDMVVRVLAATGLGGDVA